MRGNDLTDGRFTLPFEVYSIHEGIGDDLQQPVGQFLDWWVWDPESTVMDQTYDVGGYSGGRFWEYPIRMPVVDATIIQDDMYQNPRGFYTSDTMSFTINAGDVYRLLPDMLDSPDVHYKDRIQWRGSLFVPVKIYPKGYIRDLLVTVVVDAMQVTAEENVNDNQFNNAPDPYQ